MKMLTTIALIILVAVTAVFWSDRAIRKRLSRFYARSCAGRQWRRRFPHATKAEIRGFLHLFVDAFMLDRRRAVFFSPDDRIMNIYRAIYPSPFLADADESLTLARRCKQLYGIDVMQNWHEQSTLGDLFHAIHPNA